MAQDYPKHLKKCAVCDYWGGAREVHPTRSRVYVDNPHIKGKCIKGSFNGKDMQANQNCSTFQAWAVLR